MAAISLKRATHADLPVLLRMFGEYHAMAGIASTPIELEATLGRSSCATMQRCIHRRVPHRR